MDSPLRDMKYQVTKEECQNKIGILVCEGCGGKLEPIKTVNNAGEPTYWVGCNHCSYFRGGVLRQYFEIARKLVEDGDMLSYSHLRRSEYEGTPERLSYYLDSQTAGLSMEIRRIHKLLEEKF
jgi:hypothetical protein